MAEKKISQRSKVILFALLIILNVVLRIPSIPHEKGGDSFYIHSLANSITSFGVAKWWINWLAIFGLYPDSYASAVPFSVSGMAQLIGLTGIEMEKTILLYSVALGLFSIFTAYIMAGMIYDDFLFKYFMALFFSGSQGILVFSTWELSTRGPFIIFFPLIFFLLLKKMKPIKTICLLFILVVFLASVHHYFWFSIILIILFVSLKILSKISKIQILSKIRILNNKPHFLNYLYLVGFIVLFMFPFFTRTFITSGSRYEWVVDILISNTRYIGPIIILTFGGLTYLILKSNKKFEEWYILCAILLFTPFMYSLTYAKYILLLFFIFFIAVAFRNFLNNANRGGSKIFAFFVLIILLSFVGFSAFYNHYRTGESKSYWYMQDSTYYASKWSKKYIPENTRGFGNEGETWRLFATSDAHPVIPTAGAVAFAYNLINGSDVKVLPVSPSSSDFYFEGPYVEQSGTSLWGLMSWFLDRRDIDDTDIVKSFNFKYFIEDVYNRKNIVPSIHVKKEILYTNGRIMIWLL